MAHDHHDHSHGKGRVLFASLALTLAFVVVETIAGFRASSLALLSDAGHNFTDAFALLLAAIAVYLQSRPADQSKTYGYQRAGVLVAFVNALILIALAGLLFYESAQRLRHPQPVAETTMMIVAAIGLAVNLAIVWGIGHGHDLNLRAAWLHMLGDAASSAGIIAGAIAIRYTGVLAIDPILSILIACGILWSAWGIIKDSLNILLEGLPKGLTLADVSRDLRGISGVIDVHDLHIWSLGSEAHALSCHVLIEDMPPSASDSILRRINSVLCDRFEIHHTTIQFEHMRCKLADESCTKVKHRH
ncbi:MAG TPA: cation diffusion facilitator family transporter [Bryobacteraceae bacterium]|nr:cation diffusion facilitator family transporter [Bryobacteraceae bacterium]